MTQKNSHRRGSRLRPLKMNITLKGDRGKPLRIAVLMIAAIVVLVLAANIFRPKVQLQNTPEYNRIQELGVLTVGVLDDMPGFSDNGEGFEVELAKRFAQYLLPDSEGDAAIKLVTVTDMTASTKLSDGSVDAVFARMQKGGSSRFSYSYAYYTDECVVAIPGNADEKPLNEMVIGYVQSSASQSVLNTYISEHKTTVKQSFIDKLLKRKVELPPDAITFTTKAFASYPDMLLALSKGSIDGAAIAKVYLNRYSEGYDFKIHSTTLGSIGYSLACSSDEPAIAQLADMFIYKLRESGELDEMLSKYGLE